MGVVSGGVASAKMQELKDLARRRPIDRKRGPIGDKISKLLVYGEKQMHGGKLESRNMAIVK